VVRRLSGGGTVFHDLGNVNFAFIQNGREGSLVDFKKFIEPILQALQKMGVPATVSGRNDLLIEGLKISGNAEHVFKNRTLHHGTLLFSSRLDELRAGLKVKLENYTDKAVRSVRSPVTNISEYLPNLTIEEFIGKIQTTVQSLFTKTQVYSYSQEDILATERLVTEKYATWDWNFGYSPKFKVRKQGSIENKIVDIEIQVEKGMIKQIEALGNTKLPITNRNFIELPYNENRITENLTGTMKNSLLLQWIELLFN
jgi:lipoate-protein ligase A